MDENMIINHSKVVGFNNQHQLNMHSLLSNQRRIVLQSNDNNGLDAASYELLQITTECYRALMAKECDENVPPKKLKLSTEAFEYPSQRRRNTQITLESIQETWRDFWIFIANKLKQFVIFLKAHYHKRSLSRRLFRNDLEQINRTLTNINTPKSTLTLKLGSVARKLNINGKIPIDLTQEFSNILTLTQTILSTTGPVKDKALIESIKRALNNPTERIDDALNTKFAAIDGLVLNHQLKNDGVVGVFESARLMGNFQLTQRALVSKNTSFEDIMGCITKFHSKLVLLDSQSEVTKEMPVINVIEAKKLTNIISSLLMVIDDYSSKINMSFESIDQLSALSTSMAARKQDGRNQEYDKNLQALVIALPKFIKEPYLSFMDYVLGLIHASIAYLKHYIKTR